MFTNVTSAQQWDLGVERSVSDGQWHVLVLRRSGPRTVLLLDGRPVVDITHSIISHINFIVEVITLGSGPSGQVHSGTAC